jgi:hypothetical protein
LVSEAIRHRSSAHDIWQLSLRFRRNWSGHGHDRQAPIAQIAGIEAVIRDLL